MFLAFINTNIWHIIVNKFNILIFFFFVMVMIIISYEDNLDIFVTKFKDILQELLNSDILEARVSTWIMVIFFFISYLKLNI